MANNKYQWEELGRSVQYVVDRAVHSQDYQKLNDTIRQVVGHAVDLGSEVVRRKPTVVEQRNVAELYGSTGRVTAGGVLRIVGGSCLTAVSAVLCVTGLVIGLLDGSFVPALVSLAPLGGGAALIGSGVGRVHMVSRFKSYQKTLGQKTHCTIQRLAQSVGKKPAFVKKELQKMIGQGLFTEGHLNNEQTILITSHETFQTFEQSRLALEERKRKEAAILAKKAAVTHTPQVQQVLDKGEQFLQELNRCNDAIPGVEISRKIDRMEDIVERIFDRADSNPEVIPDLKKLLDYYLPMTVKLLNAYAQLDDQPNPGENVRSSMAEIEQTLDTLNLAFEKLLDELFADTALDVSSDISVLNTLLAQEGLTEDDLTKMRRN